LGRTWIETEVVDRRNQTRKVGWRFSYPWRRCVKESDQAEKGSQSPQVTLVSQPADGLRFRDNERIAVGDLLE
jgi:hypothetical protein